MRWLVVIVALAGCAKKSDPPPPVSANPQVPADELKRGQDACTTYVAKVCACTTDAAKQECPLAKALPEAIKVSLEIGTATEKAEEARSANREVRKVIKGCIESLAALPSLGC